MVKARKLIGTFTGSSQNLEKLISAQEVLRNDSIPKTLIQDVVTRWWSTYKSIERLLDLKPVIDYLTHANPPVGYTLDIDEWETLEIIKSVLEPFRNMQLYLEGSEYETIGFVAYCVNDLRYHIDMSIDQYQQVATATGTAILNLLVAIKAKFREKFGSGVQIGSEIYERYSDYLTPGIRNSHVGLPKVTMMAAFLDPRFKHLSFFVQEDQLRIIADVRNEMEIQLAGNVADSAVRPVQRPRHALSQNSIFFRNDRMLAAAAANPVEQTAADCIRNELESYCNEPCQEIHEYRSETEVIH
jgi:hypothetical protein